MIDVNSKTVEFDINDTGEAIINDFKLLRGKKEDCLVFINSDCEAKLCLLDYQNRNGLIIDSKKISNESIKLRSGLSVATSKKNDYVLAEFGGQHKNTGYSTQLVVFSTKDKTLIQKAIVHSLFPLSASQNLYSYCLSYKSCILWAEFSLLGETKFYEFDSDVGEIKPLNKFTLDHQEKMPMKISPFGKFLYYTGSKGKVYRMDFKA